MILMYINARDVEAYTQQGWRCTLLRGHHGYWRRFLAVMEL